MDYGVCAWYAWREDGGVAWGCEDCSCYAVVDSVGADALGGYYVDAVCVTVVKAAAY